MQLRDQHKKQRYFRIPHILIYQQSYAIDQLANHLFSSLDLCQSNWRPVGLWEKLKANKSHRDQRWSILKLMINLYLNTSFHELNMGKNSKGAILGLHIVDYAFSLLDWEPELLGLCFIYGQGKFWVHPNKKLQED